MTAPSERALVWLLLAVLDVAAWGGIVWLLWRLVTAR